MEADWEISQFEAAIKLGLPLSDPLSHEKMVFKFMKGQWQLVKEVIFESLPRYTIYLTATAVLGYHDNYLTQAPGIGGNVVGRGYIYYQNDPTEKDSIKLKDLKVNLSGAGHQFTDLSGSFFFAGDGGILRFALSKLRTRK